MGNEFEIRQQTNKRLILNLLIQGSASHAFTSASHLVKDELEATSIWRRFLAVVPRDVGIAKSLMHAAQMTPDELENFMFSVVEDTAKATSVLHTCAQN